MKIQIVSRQVVLIAAILGVLPVSQAQGIGANNTPVSLPPSFVIATSGPGSDGRSWANAIDISGDTLVRAQPLLSGTALGFTVDGSGTFGETIGTAGSMDSFPAGLGLNPSTVALNGLAGGSCTASISAPTGRIFALDIKTNSLDVGSPTGPTGSGQYSVVQAASVASTPITITGSEAKHRYFVISQNVPYGVACNNIPHDVTANGTATVVDVSSSVSTGGTSALGKCPVFAITSSDGRRSFVLNRGSDSISVIDVDQGAVSRTISLQPAAGTTAGPVHAAYVPSLGKLLVANYENDTVSVVNVQTDKNGADGPSFGQVTTIDLWNSRPHVCAVGLGASHPCMKHPTWIDALPDGTRAYVANQGDGSNSDGSDGSVAILDLKLNAAVYRLGINTGGHPRTLALGGYSTSNSTLAKLYVATPDVVSTTPGIQQVIPYMKVAENSLIATDCNNAAPCGASGEVIDVRVTQINATTQGGTPFTATVLSGAGQPCAMPIANPKNLASCRAHP